MSTDLPPDAIDHGIAQELIFADGTKWWGGGVDYRIVAIPVPAPEPPSLAERLEARFSWIGSSGPRLGDWQDAIDDLGLVCRDEVPTLQPLDPTEFTLWAANSPWFTKHWHMTEEQSEEWDEMVGALVARFGVPARPDQEPDT